MLFKPSFPCKHLLFFFHILTNFFSLNVTVSYLGLVSNIDYTILHNVTGDWRTKVLYPEWEWGIRNSHYSHGNANGRGVIRERK